MFRRRGLLRHFRRSLTAVISPALLQANRLLTLGDYPAAAQEFEELAHRAMTRNRRRAPFLLFQAGRIRLQAGQIQMGMANFQQGLRLLAARGQWQRYRDTGQRLIGELSQQGLTEQARQIEATIKSGLPADFVPTEEAEKTRRVLLPTHCPGCGGPLRPNEIEWIDEISVECPYCGSAVRAEE